MLSAVVYTLLSLLSLPVNQSPADECTAEQIELFRENSYRNELFLQINEALSAMENKPMVALDDAILNEIFRNGDFIKFYRDNTIEIPYMFEDLTATEPRTCGDMIYLTFDPGRCVFSLNLTSGARDIGETTDAEFWCPEHTTIYTFSLSGPEVKLLRIDEAG